MKKYLLVVTTIMLILATQLTGCSLGFGGSSNSNALPYKNNEVAVKKGSEANAVFDEIFYFVENLDNPDLGTLYIQKNINAKEKISDAVKKNSFRYLYNKKAVVFIDLENNLYIKEQGNDKSKIASDVFPGSIKFSEDESTLAFLCTKSLQVDSQFPAELYIVKLGEEREKLSSNVYLGGYALSYDGSVVAFKTNDSSLYIKKKKQNEKEKVASNVVSFTLSGKGNAILYQKDNDGMYYKLDEASESQKVYTGTAGLVQLAYQGDTFCYLADYNQLAKSSKGELYLVKPGLEPIKVSSDIVQYTLSPDGRRIYYKNNDNSLYTIELPELKKSNDKNINKFKETMRTQEKRKLGDDVNSYFTTIDGGTIMWTNTDFDLYCLEPGIEKQKLASNIETFSMSGDVVVFLNKDKELYDISKADIKKPFDTDTKLKIASDIIGYSNSPYCRYIAYATTAGELYHLTVEGQPIKLSDILNDFDTTYFINRQVYEKRLQVKDIVGTWMSLTNDEVMEIKDNVMTHVTDTNKSERKFTVIKSNKKELMIDEGYPETSRFKVEYEDRLSYHFGEGLTKEYVRISKEEYAEEVALLENKSKEEQALKAKKNAAKTKALQILSNKGAEVKKGTRIYENHSLSSKSTELDNTLLLRLTDYYIDEGARIWLHAEDSFYKANFWYVNQ